MSQVINESNKLVIDKIIKNTPGSCLLLADERIGLKQICDYIATESESEFSYIYPEKDEKIDIQNGKIKIESIRRLYDYTKTRSKKKQIYFIYGIDKATESAQNAILKLLEEPSVGVHFILTASSDESILPTILSRVIKTEILPVSKEQSLDYIVSKGISDKNKQLQLLFIASGYINELEKLIKDEDYFNRMVAIFKDAKLLLGSTNYEKFQICSKYKDSRDNSITLIQTMISMLKSNLINTPSIDTIGKINRLIELVDKLKSNGNIRLLLTKISI